MIDNLEWWGSVLVGVAVMILVAAVIAIPAWIRLVFYKRYCRKRIARANERFEQYAKLLLRPSDD